MGSGAVPSSPSHSFNMVRFLKKLFKCSKKTAPPEKPAPRITSIDAERDRDPEGEYRSRKISVDKAAGGTDSTATPDANHRESSRITNRDGRVGDRQVPAPDASARTPVHGGDNTSEHNWLWLFCPAFILHPYRTARTAHAQGLRGRAGRAARSKRSQSPPRRERFNDSQSEGARRPWTGRSARFRSHL